MASSTSVRARIPLVTIVIGSLVVAGLIVGAIYFSRPASPAAQSRPSPEAVAYLSNVRLSDMDMKASENFMKQQVVEVTGKISNVGPKTIERMDVLCIFSGVNGSEVHRERVPIVNSAGGTPLGPNQTRSFRLPFDSLPDNWNQAKPQLVIAQIKFAR